MNFTDIKTFIVGSDKIARPKQLKDKFKFKSTEEDFKKQHHYAVDESLTPGEYDADKFEHWVWQIEHTRGWSTISQDEYDAVYYGTNVNLRKYLPLKQQDKDMRDASYFEILSNVPGKQQYGINMPILKLWGEVESFYGDPHKNETGRQLLLRIQNTYNISFKEVEPKYQPESHKFGEWISREEYDKLKAQLNNQAKHKDSIRDYWLSCSESKKKWVEAIKEYFDREYADSIQTFEDFKEQFDLD